MYLVYQHRKADTNEIFYVGKGKKKRAFYLRQRNNHHTAIVSKLTSMGLAVDIRIIKSHVFANHIDFIKKTWPECPLILALRDDDSCLGWWVRCGHFNITYPKYDKYYKNLKEMSKIIDHQNRDIRTAWDSYDGIIARDNRELSDILGLGEPPAEYNQVYAQSDLEVKVI